MGKRRSILVSILYSESENQLLWGHPLSIIPMDLRFDGIFYTNAIVAGVFHLPLDLTQVLSIVHRLFDNILSTH